MEIFIDGIHVAVIQSVNPFDGRVTAKEVGSGTLWYGIDPKRIKSEPVVLVALPQVEGEVPVDETVSTAKVKESLRIRSRLSEA
jgi:hypothetical protein